MNWRLMNRLLLIAIVIINLYVIAMPLTPRLVFWLQRQHGAQFANLSRTLHTNVPAVQDNRLIVPAMLLNQPIVEGTSLAALSRGPWRLPHGSTPDKGGNTLIVGHRFTYTNPRGSFYSLDHVQVGDELGVFWQGKKYLYKVRETKVVPATAREVEAPTQTPRLTLYTCTPLWNPKDRLVVVASLEAGA